MKGLFEFLNLYKNYYFRRFAVGLFNNSFIVNSHIYKLFHKREIKSRIGKFNTNSPGIQVELTTACNANCVMCSYDQLSRPKGTMTGPLFKKIVDEAADWGVPLLHLCGMGETLLGGPVVDYVKYAKKRGINEVRINTNGSLLNPSIANQLIDSGLDEILVSVDHGHKNEYEAIRKNLKFDVLIKNLEYILKKRKSLNKNKPLIGINAVSQNKDLKQIQTVYQKFSKKVDYIVFQAAWNWAGAMHNESPLTNRNKFRFPCPYPWLFLNISWNGDVSICCVDFDNTVLVGNIVTAGLKEVWKSEAFTKLRSIHMAKEFSKIPACESCDNFANWWIRY